MNSGRTVVWRASGMKYAFDHDSAFRRRRHRRRGGRAGGGDRRGPGGPVGRDRRPDAAPREKNPDHRRRPVQPRQRTPDAGPFSFDESRSSSPPSWPASERARSSASSKSLGLRIVSDGGRLYPATNQAASVLKVLELEVRRRRSRNPDPGFEAVAIERRKTYPGRRLGRRPEDRGRRRRSGRRRAVVSGPGGGRKRV